MKLNELLKNPVTLIVIIIFAATIFSIIDTKQREYKNIMFKIRYNDEIESNNIKEEEIKNDNIILKQRPNLDNNLQKISGIDIKNVKYDSKKYVLTYEIENNTNESVYLSNEIMKTFKYNENIVVPLIDFVGYKKLLNPGQKIELSTIILEEEYIAIHDTLIKVIYSTNTYEEIGFVEIKF